MPRVNIRTRWNQPKSRRTQQITVTDYDVAVCVRSDGDIDHTLERNLCGFGTGIRISGALTRRALGFLRALSILFGCCCVLPGLCGGGLGVRPSLQHLIHPALVCLRRGF